MITGLREPDRFSAATPSPFPPIEEFDADTGRHPGSHPQMFSHPALIGAAGSIIFAERTGEL